MILPKTLLNFFFLMSIGVLVTGCHTFEGFGKDVKETGEGIEETAKENTPHTHELE